MITGSSPIRLEKPDIKIAAMAELREIVDFLIEDFHDRYRDTLPPADFGKVVLYVGNHIQNGVVFTARDPSGELCGVISGLVTCPWFSTHPHVAEGCFFVSPDMRGTGAGVALLRHLGDWADKRGLPLICAVSTGDEVERKDRFFERQGFTRIGGIYRTKGH
jgi:GNAT superfamily N-acetyltransferase